MTNTHAGSSPEKALDRVRKLFAKAESVAGTPEAEVLLERAYALLAKYGVDETLARAGTDPSASEVMLLAPVVSGKYQPDQVGLVASLCAAMHCRAVTSRRGDGARVVHIVGARRHVERVGMLAGALTGIMLAAAAGQRPRPGISAVTHRKSFMTGFAFEVGRRLGRSRRARTPPARDSSCAQTPSVPRRRCGVAFPKRSRGRGVTWEPRGWKRAAGWAVRSISGSGASGVSAGRSTPDSAGMRRAGNPCVQKIAR